MAFAASPALPGTGDSTPLSAATAAATSASACTQVLASDSRALAIGIAQSSATKPIAFTAQPLRAACRIRCANRGWSLRRLDPTTNTRCNSDKDAIEVPRYRTPSDAGNSALRKRQSTFSLPRPRMKALARDSSSSVLCGLSKAPMLWAPCSDLICFRPLATYSSAVCQSTGFQTPPCLSMGVVRRSSLFKAS